MKPVIGILGNLMYNQVECNLMERAFVSNAYVESVIKSDGIPFIIPVNTKPEVIKEQIKLIDGLILSGGVDVNPNIYNEEPTREMECFYPELDEFDLIAITEALENKIPILGICRGIQVLNVHQGGTLYQDISHIEGSYIKHVQDTKTYASSHTVLIEKDSKLSDILGNEIKVNSYHHQSVKDLGKNLRKIAESKDGVIEAIEMIDEKFVVGVQWHPELMVNHNEKMLNIFKKFINVCCDK